MARRRSFSGPARDGKQKAREERSPPNHLGTLRRIGSSNKSGEGLSLQHVFHRHNLLEIGVSVEYWMIVLYNIDISIHWKIST
jgi:hypothetical protein